MKPPLILSSCQLGLWLSERDGGQKMLLQRGSSLTENPEFQRLNYVRVVKMTDYSYFHQLSILLVVFTFTFSIGTNDVMR